MEAQTVVGVGASAGGLEALEKLLDGSHADGRTAYVVVTHLSPDFKSLLDELLKRHTDMPVRVVEEGMQIKADTVYVIPPNTEMIVMGNRLHLSDREKAPAQALPINVFLSSLAREYGANAIAVILSGSGSDGAKGVEEIRAAGGLVVVQNPTTARFDSMPSAAINACLPARVAHAERIGEVIAAHINGHDIDLGEDNANAVSFDGRAQTLSEILSLIYGVSNVDFSLYKMKTIYRRVRRRMVATEHETLEGYRNRLQNDPEELNLLADELLITVSEFFRDPEAFAYLEEHIIPRLVAESTPSKPIRLWVAACSSGQEAYSLAILLYLESRKQGVIIDPQIYATDLRAASVQQAGQGVFSESDLKFLPDDVREECFEQTDDGDYRILQRIRRWMVFAEHNILRDPPFTRLDFISCRNLLIYFEPDAQRKSLSLFNFGLKDRGILFLGRSESLGDVADDFEVVNQTWRIFRKIGMSTSVNLSIGSRLESFDKSESRSSWLSSAATLPPSFGKQRISPAYAALIDRFMPQGALVSASREVMHLFGDADDFLRAPKGMMDTDILKMVPAPLRTPLAAALERAGAEKQEVVFPHLRVIMGSEEIQVCMRVAPLVLPNASEAKYFFVGIERDQDSTPIPGDNSVIYDAKDLESERIASLERDLQVTRENLQATIEEVETSNEELQSTNEELMASNEELQSTNEELQSVNEELYTVNAEYQKKNDELEEISRDIDNLIASTAIGVIFVDSQLRIRRFTDAVSRILNVAPVDVGRKLMDITHRLINLDLTDLIRTALDERRIRIADAMDQNGDWWQVRVIPMAAQWGKGDGAVVTLYEISSLRAAQLEAEARTSDLRLIAEMTGAHVIHQRPDGSFNGPEPGWIALSGQRGEAALGFGWIDATCPESTRRLRSFWQNATPKPNHVIQTHLRIQGETDDDYRHMTVLSLPEFNASDAHVGWVSVLLDVEQTVQSGEAVSDSERLLDTVLQIIPSRISYIDADKRYRYTNQGCEEALNLSRKDILSRHVVDVLPDDMHVQALSHIERALAGQSTEYTLHRVSQDGQPEVLHVHYEPDVRSDGRVVGLASSTRDITRAIADIDEQLQQKAVIAEVLSRSSLALLVIPDVHAKISSASAGASRMTGYSAFDLRQKTLSDLLPEFDTHRLDAIIARQMGTVGEPESYKTFLINRMGNSIDVEFEVACRNGDGQAPVIVFIRDRTTSSGTEVALRRRTEELSRSNRMLEVFAAAATHELTSPLRRVAKFAQLLRSDHGLGLSEEASGFLDIVVDETDRMRRSVGAVIELVRLERIKIDLTSVDLSRTADMALGSLRERIDAVGARVDVAPLPKISGDPTQLEILFRNLVVNAISHRHPARIPHIRIEAEVAEGGILVLSFVDNGNGVPTEKEAEIFLPFVRVDASKDSIGMGLALCRRISEVHNGSLDLAETSPDGSRFVVRLPMS